MTNTRSEDEHRTALMRFYDAFNARDLPRILAELHPDIDFESRFARAGGTTYRGHEGVRGWLADLADAWEYIVIDLGATRDSLPDHTIAQVTLRGKGRASGVEINEPATHELWWRDGKLARLGYVDGNETAGPEGRRRRMHPSLETSTSPLVPEPPCPTRSS